MTVITQLCPIASGWLARTTSDDLYRVVALGLTQYGETVPMVVDPGGAVRPLNRHMPYELLREGPV